MFHSDCVEGGGGGGGKTEDGGNQKTLQSPFVCSICKVGGSDGSCLLWWWLYSDCGQACCLMYGGWKIDLV